MASRKKSTSKTAGRARKKPSGVQRRPASNSPGAWFEKLVGLQARLRASNGCPWDREQTHSTLRTYLIEEAYEVLDALESGDDEKFADEMGDLLLQIVFHSQIATEQGRFTVSDVIRAVHEKMVRRHPHVFGDQRAKDAEEVLKHWHQIKAQERRAKAAGSPAEQLPESALNGVPRTLPSTLQALQLTKQAARTGFDWPDVAGILDKIQEEIAELRCELPVPESAKTEEEVGDLLFAAVNLARFLKIDPEIALKNANAKFIGRFREMERVAAAMGRKFPELPRGEKESLWDAAKRAGRPPIGQNAGRSQ